MELVIFLGADYEARGQIEGLIKKGEWEKIILIGNKMPPYLTLGKEVEVISLDSSRRVLDMRDDLKKRLKERIKGIEIALNIASGNGKEHMALISALLSLPVGIRLTVLTREGIVEL